MVLKFEEVLQRMGEEFLADVVKAVKADERYAPLVAQIAGQLLKSLAG